MQIHGHRRTVLPVGAVERDRDGRFSRSAFRKDGQKRKPGMQLLIRAGKIGQRREHICAHGFAALQGTARQTKTALLRQSGDHDGGERLLPAGAGEEVLPGETDDAALLIGFCEGRNGGLVRRPLAPGLCRGEKRQQQAKAQCCGGAGFPKTRLVHDSSSFFQFPAHSLTVRASLYVAEKICWNGAFCHDGAKPGAPQAQYAEKRKIFQRTRGKALPFFLQCVYNISPGYRKKRSGRRNRSRKRIKRWPQNHEQTRRTGACAPFIVYR